MAGDICATREDFHRIHDILAEQTMELQRMEAELETMTAASLRQLSQNLPKLGPLADQVRALVAESADTSASIEANVMDMRRTAAQLEQLHAVDNYLQTTTCANGLVKDAAAALVVCAHPISSHFSPLPDDTPSSCMSVWA